MPNMRNTKNPMPSQEPQVRAHNFNEVALGYTEEQALLLTLLGHDITLWINDTYADVHCLRVLLCTTGYIGLNADDVVVLCRDVERMTVEV